MKKRKIGTTIRMAETLYLYYKEKAKKEGKSFNSYVNELIKKKVGIKDAKR